MISLILAIPIRDFTQEELNYINSIKAQWVDPMPGTRVVNNTRIVDALVKDTFNDGDLPSDFKIMYKGTPDTTIQELDPTFIEYLNDIVEYDANGNVIATSRPTELYVPHNWAGHKPRYVVPGI